MMDDIGRGILSGLLALPLAQWARKFKYRTIFVVGWLGTNAYLFLGLARIRGYNEAAHLFIEKAFTPIGFLLPLGVGLLGVILVFVCSIGMPNRTD